MKPLELWGGVECTVNRVADRYSDQSILTGHHERDGDLDLLAGLGLAALRYPVLWERVVPDSPDRCDWTWTDRRLTRLRELGIKPVVGLVHHGSGPRYTSLLDDNFAPGLAEFAGKVALRYPWLTDWTPVNEPLTTARFSALYGLWYPHARDERSFWNALLNQIDATRLAMAAIRSTNPHARLIQTEDLGRTYSTAALADQAGFDNVRRWMTWDLLAGDVGPDHPLWHRLCRLGFERRLKQINHDPCPPDVIGINHYLTSDRFLDHRTGHYPAHLNGGNDRQRYVDVEAVRVLHPAPRGLRSAITEAWERYRRPIVLTEIHNGCSREEQLRWFSQAWSEARNARRQGIELQAVTSWALFGSMGWDTLLTGSGKYEPGAFDVSNGKPRPTALARLLSSAGEDEVVAVSKQPGWWNRQMRLHYPRTSLPSRVRVSGDLSDPQSSRPILITGATGTLGRAIAAECRHRGLTCKLTSRHELDLLDQASIRAAIDRYRPWAVVNCAGWVRVDEAEDRPDVCSAVNTDGALALTAEAARRALPSVNFSSDLVFSGEQPSPWTESDLPSPANAYGESKMAMERAIGQLPGRHLIVRTAAFFSPFDQANFAVDVARTLSGGRRYHASRDQIVSPTYTPDLCRAVVDLLIDGETGLWHLTNETPVSWFDFARRLAHGLGYDEARIEPISGNSAWKAKRPRACALASERGKLTPPLQSAIDRFCAAMATDATITAPRY